MKNLKFSAAFNIPLIRSAHKTFIGLSKHFTNKRQRVNFITFLMSLVTQGTPILSRINDMDNSKIPWFKRLSHFLKKSVTPDLVKQTYQSFIKKHLKDLQFIALDWTALVKTGLHFQYECRVYDSRDDKIHDGFPLLLATGFDTSKKRWLPLSWKLSSWTAPNFKSENIIICNFIDSLADFLKNLSTKLQKYIFLLDRGFARKLIVQRFLKHHLVFIIQMCQNRWLILADGTRIKAQELKRGFYEDVIITAWNITLNIIVGGNGKNRRILLTNLSVKDYSGAKVREMFSTRGKIEPNIREIKQGFDLEDFRVRKFTAIESMIGLILLAYVVTYLIMEKLRRHLLWVRRNIFCYKKKPGRVSAELLRRLLSRLARCGSLMRLPLSLAPYQPLPP